MAGILSLLGIRGGIAVALSIALAFVMFRADAISDERDNLKTWQIEVTRATRVASRNSEISTDSVAAQILFLGDGINLMRTEITKLNQEVLIRSAQFDRAKEQSEREIARLNEAAKVSDSRIARLRRLAEQETPSCEAPADLMQALEGL